VLKDNINQMIANLRGQPRKTRARLVENQPGQVYSHAPGSARLETVSKLILSELAPLVSAQHGVFTMESGGNHEPLLKLLTTYAYSERKHLANQFRLGEGLVGVRLEKNGFC